MQRCCVFLVMNIDLSLGGQECPEDISVAVFAGDVNGRGPVRSALVHVNALSDQRSYTAEISIARRPRSPIAPSISAKLMRSALRNTGTTNPFFPETAIPMS